MKRYEEATKDVVKIARQMIGQYFPYLKDTRIKYLFDLKKCTKGGLIILGTCRKATDIMRQLTRIEDNDWEGLDFVITIDKKAWNQIMTEDDKIKLMRHELRHALPTEEPEKVLLAPHDIEDFSIEIEMNKEDPLWARRVVEEVDDLYEKEKPKKKGKKELPVPLQLVHGEERKKRLMES